MTSFHKIKQNSSVETKMLTGDKCLDNILGNNGMSLGTIFLLEEDKYGTHSLSISKMFLAEGVLDNHALFVGSYDVDPRKIIQQLPQGKELQAKEELQNVTTTNEMKIAWRYDNLPQYNSSVKESKRSYDFSKIMDKNTLNNRNITYWDGNMEDGSLVKHLHGSFENPSYGMLLSSIHSALTKSNENNESLRISLNSIASPVWYNYNFKKDLIKFFIMLKALIKNSSSTCIVTIPAHLYTSTNLNQDKFIEKIENICDYVIELVSISRYDKLALIYKDCSGLFKIKKISAVNTLAYNFKGSYDLCYTLSRTFKIETLHLPPDIGENTDSVEIDCGGNSKKNILDF